MSPFTERIIMYFTHRMHFIHFAQKFSFRLLKILHMMYLISVKFPLAFSTVLVRLTGTINIVQNLIWWHILTFFWPTRYLNNKNLSNIFKMENSHLNLDFWLPLKNLMFCDSELLCLHSNILWEQSGTCSWPSPLKYFPLSLLQASEFESDRLSWVLVLTGRT